jgi:hypothetical protein
MACVLLNHPASMNSSLAFLAAAISAVAAASCSGPDPTPPPAGQIQLPVACSGATPSFSRDVDPIIATCARSEGCHGRFQYDDLVNVMVVRDFCNPGVRVAPGDLAHSYLIRKVTGVGMCENSLQMPPGNPLAQTDVQKIADWICSGAKND